ncbi:hypothetical protein SEA_REINDEER_152 [Mycobacterium phage Reindeer]|uniref:Uncharacterized protein n=1 Tax=Mycobacterium phage Reindeer TaxID=2762283 RepID=A0A7G8LI71_9CAUD|nr:hypothetical protein J4U05_gp100 [Mycobacterium phage Reindeer]QNJ56943.1 hypothetical protein SEA_REINDEER_152 [Mycobacterium phage Reindeer]
MAYRIDREGPTPDRNEVGPWVSTLSAALRNLARIARMYTDGGWRVEWHESDREFTATMAHGHVKVTYRIVSQI